MKFFSSAFRVCAVALIAVLPAVTSVCAAETKLGKISFIDIQKNSKKAASAMEEIQMVQIDGQKKMMALQEDVKKLQERLAKPEVKAEEKVKIETELESKRQEFETEDQAVKVKTAIRQKSLQSALGAQIKAIIDKIAKEEGYAAIFRTELMIYSEGITDLTDKITRELDAAPPLETK